MTNDQKTTSTDPESIPIFIDFEEPIESIDHSDIYELPTIKTRYISTFIDLILILLTTFGVAAILAKFENVPDYLRGALFVIIVILYEPIFISIGCTLGQLIMNIRVRRFKDPEKKILFHGAFFRLLLKWFLGWTSFISISFNKNKRAIHDYGSGSIVIVLKDVKNKASC
jgi:uncharacterized RDD family membrane protein YckC